MRELIRTLPLMCVVLLVPVLPFLVFGSRMELWLRGVADDPPSDFATALIVIGLLATDILLPIPSSVISTLSGWQLGWWRGTLATWVGMNLGAVIGFALARTWGQPFALYFSKPGNLARMQRISDRFGPMILVITRAMPVFAEASVLISGMHALAWRKFLPAIVLSNLGISVAYCAFGEYAQKNQWLPLALGVSIAIPVVIAGVAGKWLPGIDETDEADDPSNDQASA